jgi:hypothetical protein
MKTVKFISTVFLLLFSVVLISQTKTSGNTKKNIYFVQTTHTPDQCLNSMTAIRDKGENLLSKFEFGCMSGDHTAYAFIEGKSEADVRQMLPKEAQANAKIQKVDKFTPDQIEKIHKDMGKAQAK